MVIIGFSLDGIGVLIIATGASIATVHALINRRDPFVERYQLLRQNLGRAILVGLEFIIAGDIIRTVVIDPTILNVTVLGLIILIRTFLSIMLHFEVEGHWPWQNNGTLKL